MRRQLVETSGRRRPGLKAPKRRLTPKRFFSLRFPRVVFTLVNLPSMRMFLLSACNGPEAGFSPLHFAFSPFRSAGRMRYLASAGERLPLEGPVIPVREER